MSACICAVRQIAERSASPWSFETALCLHIVGKNHNELPGGQHQKNNLDEHDQVSPDWRFDRVRKCDHSWKSMQMAILLSRLEWVGIFVPILLASCCRRHYDFFLEATAFAFAAFLRLLRIMTTPRKLPTTVDPRSTRITGIRMAQTLGGKTS